MSVAVSGVENRVSALHTACAATARGGMRPTLAPDRHVHFGLPPPLRYKPSLLDAVRFRFDAGGLAAT